MILCNLKLYLFGLNIKMSYLDIIDMIKQIANERYRQSDATELLAIRMTQQRTAMMKPQEEFNINYFKELIEYITLDEYGKVTLTTKTKAEVTERTENG